MKGADSNDQTAMSAKMREALADLGRQANQDRPETLPTRLPLGDIKMIPELFQPRNGMSEAHAEELSRALRDHKDLDPVLIMQAGGWPVLIDGHHRVAAYRKTKGAHTIPVRYFEGTIPEAIAASGLENSKVKLSMTKDERQDYAWRLTKMGLHGRHQTARVSGAGASQVAIMRQVLAKLGGERSATFPCWMDAKRAAAKLDGAGPKIDDDWLHAQAQKHADRMYKAFGTKLSGNLGMLALTLEKYVGVDRVGELAELLGTPSEDDEDGPAETRF